ncbi:MAG: hypothetical protein R3C28_14580 [Pirellulaceae bacterium]
MGSDKLLNDAASDYRDRLEAKVGISETWSSQIAAIAKYPERSRQIQELVQLVQRLPIANQKADSIQDKAARTVGSDADRPVLLVGLLRAIGIDAYAAMILSPNRVSGKEFSSFGRVIVYVPKTDTSPEYWLSPTWMDSNRDGSPYLLQDVAVQVLSMPLKPHRHLPATRLVSKITEAYDITIFENGDVKWKLRHTVRGPEERKLRNLLATMPQEFVREVMQDRFRFIQLGEAENQVQIEIPNLEDSTNPLTFIVSSTTPQHAIVDFPRLSVTFIDSMAYHFPYTAKPRKYPLVTSPLEVTIEYSFHAPEGFSLPTGPEVHRDFGDASLTTTMRANENSLLVARHWNAGDGKFSAEEVNAIRESLSPMVRLEFLHMPEAYFANGQFRQSVEALQDQFRIHPESVELRRYQINLAERLGLFAWTQELQSKAVADFPDHVGLQVSYAVDQLPNSFRFDFNQRVDRNKVTEMMENLRSRHPDDPRATIVLANWLMRDDDGNIAIGDLANDRIRQLQELYDSSGSEQVLVRLFQMLYYSNRTAEAQTLLERAPQGPIRDHLMVVVKLDQQGAESFLFDETIDLERRVSVMVNCGQELFGLRRYDSAEKIFDLLASRSDKPAVFEPVLQYCAAREPFESRSFTEDDPAQAAFNYLVDAILHGPEHPNAQSHVLSDVDHDNCSLEWFVRYCRHPSNADKHTLLGQVDAITKLPFTSQAISNDLHVVTVTDDVNCCVIKNGDRFQLLGFLELTNRLLLWWKQGEHDTVRNLLATGHKNELAVNQSRKIPVTPFTLEPATAAYDYWINQNQQPDWELLVALRTCYSSEADALELLEKERPNLDDAIAVQVTRAKRIHWEMKSEHAKALKFARELSQQNPDEWIPFHYAVHSHMALEQWSDANQLVQQRLQLKPDDSRAKLLQAHILTAQRKLDEARPILRQVALDSREQDLQEICRLYAYQNDVPAEVVTRLNEFDSHFAIPAQYAALAHLEITNGNYPGAARLLKLQQGDSLGYQYWVLAQARIAEACGLSELAQLLYGKITRPSEYTPNSLYDLAQQRISLLASQSPATGEAD